MQCQGTDRLPATLPQLRSVSDVTQRGRPSRASLLHCKGHLRLLFIEMPVTLGNILKRKDLECLIWSHSHFIIITLYRKENIHPAGPEMAWIRFCHPLCDLELNLSAKISTKNPEILYEICYTEGTNATISPLLSPNLHPHTPLSLSSNPSPQNS